MAKKGKFKKVVATVGAGAMVFGAGAATTVVAQRVQDNKAPKEIVVTLQEGDNLYELSERYFGSGIYYEDIADYNGIKNPAQVRAGDVVRMPGKVSDGTKLNPVYNYEVQPGDTLTSICEKFYRDTSYEIICAFGKYNDIDNMDFIREGQIIRIPIREELNLENTMKR